MEGHIIYHYLILYISYYRQISELQNQNLDRLEEIAILKAHKKENGKRTKSNQEEIAALKLQNSNLLSRIDQLEKANKFQSDSVATNTKQNTLLPRNCEDLFNMGHTLNGIYLVRNDDDKSNSNTVDVSKILSVHCIFSVKPNPVTRKLGYISMKSTSRGVHFFVQKTQSFKDERGIVPFEVAKLNVGGGMDVRSEVFTAPISGIYFFAFKGMKLFDLRALSIKLRVNGVRIGEAYAPGANGGIMLATHATLKLEKGDKVDMFEEKHVNGDLYDNGHSNTQFIGWLVEEQNVMYYPSN